MSKFFYFIRDKNIIVCNIIVRRFLVRLIHKKIYSANQDIRNFFVSSIHKGPRMKDKTGLGPMAMLHVFLKAQSECSVLPLC